VRCSLLPLVRARRRRLLIDKVCVSLSHAVASMFSTCRAQTVRARKRYAPAGHWQVAARTGRDSSCWRYTSRCISAACRSRIPVARRQYTVSGRRNCKHPLRGPNPCGGLSQGSWSGDRAAFHQRENLPLARLSRSTCRRFPATSPSAASAGATTVCLVHDMTSPPHSRLLAGPGRLRSDRVTLVRNGKSTLYSIKEAEAESCEDPKVLPGRLGELSLIRVDVD
jgi:hypothetical protein